MSDQVIKGGKELDAVLKSLAPKLEKNIMRAALRAGANELRAEARANVPVDQGDLRASIRVSTRAKRGTVYASVKVGGKKAPHAHLVEFGTKPHKILPKDDGGLVIGSKVVAAIDHPGARPKPFMRPALDARAQQAIGAVAAKIRERLTKEGIDVPATEAD